MSESELQSKSSLFPFRKERRKKSEKEEGTARVQGCFLFLAFFSLAAVVASVEQTLKRAVSQLLQ